MAQPTTLAGSKLSIWLGDGASPEVFTAPCGLTTKGFDLSASSNDTIVPDCDLPDAPAWTERSVRSLSGQITGSGVMAVESFDTWKAAALSGNPINARVKFDHTELGYYTGRWILSALKYNGVFGNKIEVDVTMDSDGAITWVEV